MRFRILEDLTISSTYYRVERIKRSMNETATSRRCLFLTSSSPSSPSLSISFFLFLSLLPTFFLFSRSPLISRRQVEGGDDSEAEMEQLESGESVCLSLTLFSPDRSFIPSVHSLITAALCQFPTIPALFPLRPFHPSWCSGGIRDELRDEGVRIYYKRRSGETLFFVKNSPPSL